MRAARWHGRRDVRIDRVPDLGSPAPGWLRARVEVCGICGTDVDEYLRGPNLTPLKPNPLTGRCAPLTMGHEAVGIVEEIGPDVDLEVGTRIAIEANVFCGECFWCKRHEYPLCAMLAALGQQTDGGLADQAFAPAYMCIPYGDSIAAELMALAEPLAVAVRAVRRAGVCEGTTVGIVGAGTIGLLTAQVARLCGAAKIVSIDNHASRRVLASGFGVDATATPEDANATVHELTGGVGTDVMFEAAGNTAAAVAAIKLVRKGGRAVLLGVYEGVVPVDMMEFLLAEKEIIASLSHVYDEDFAAAVKLIDEGRVDVAPLITDRIGLDEVVTKGFHALAEDATNHLKILVFPAAG